MGTIAGSAVFIDRLVLLIQQYLTATVVEVDTAANALAPAEVPRHVADFDTPALDVSTDVVGFTGDFLSNRRNTVLVMEEGPTRRENIYHDDEGTGTNLPRWQRKDVFEITVSSARIALSEGVGRVYRETDRIKEAIAIILGRYPLLSVPDATPAIATLLNYVIEVTDDRRASEINAEEQTYCAKRIMTIETIRQESG